MHVSNINLSLSVFLFTAGRLKQDDGVRG